MRNKNIFLHFMNEEVLKYLRHSKPSFQNEKDFIEKMLRLALIASPDKCLIPPAFIMENKSNLELIYKYKHFFIEQKLSLLVKEETIDEFFRKKEKEYENNRELSSYSGYYDTNIRDNIRELFSISNTKRPFSVGKAIMDFWEQDLSEKKSLIGFERIKARCESFINDEDFIADLESLSYEIKNKAFVWSNIENDLNIAEEMKYAVWRSILLYYIKAHLISINCSILHSNDMYELFEAEIEGEYLLKTDHIINFLESNKLGHILDCNIDDFINFCNSNKLRIVHNELDQHYSPSNTVILFKDAIQKNEIFLGETPTEDEIENNLSLPIYADGLNYVDSKLILSALPKGSSGAYLTALQKGLSGANVFAITVLIGEERRRSKTYVVKIGDSTKLETEKNNYQKYVSQYLSNYAQPIWRKHGDRFALFQEFKHYSSRDKEVKSLKQLLKDSPDYDIISNNIDQAFIILDTLRKKRSTQQKAKYSEILSWYIERFNKEIKSISRYKDIINRQYKSFSGKDICDFVDTYKNILNENAVIQKNVIHGDFHSENILIDSNAISWLIDFYWTTESDSIIDFVMLEISLKFVCIPHCSDLSMLFEIERKLTQRMRYGMSSINKLINEEFQNALNIKIIETIYKIINRIRIEAKQKCNAKWSHYRKTLFLLTCSQLVESKMEIMNVPFMLCSIGLLADEINNSKNE